MEAHCSCSMNERSNSEFELFALRLHSSETVRRSAQRDDIDLFPGRSDEDIGFIGGMGKIRQAPGLRNCFQ
jgi:hypothetical protein